MGDGGGLAAYNDCRQGTRMRRMQMADVSSGHGDTLLTEAMQRSADKFPFEAPSRNGGYTEWQAGEIGSGQETVRYAGLVDVRLGAEGWDGCTPGKT